MTTLNGLSKIYTLQNVKRLILGEILLKKIVNNQNKWLFAILISTIFSVFYLIIGALSYQNGVIISPLNFENKIPMIPITSWGYVFFLIYIIWSIKVIKDDESLNKLLYSFLLIGLISHALYLIFPLIFPREYYPLLQDGSTSKRLLLLIRTLDRPSNCFPSLQAGICFIFALVHKKESRLRFYLSIIISLLIVTASLTIKQHYIYDIIAALILSLSVFYIMKMTKYE